MLSIDRIRRRNNPPITIHKIDKTSGVLVPKIFIEWTIIIITPSILYHFHDVHDFGCQWDINIDPGRTK